VIGADRPSIRYRSRRPHDAAARARLRELAAVPWRFGYRRLQILLRRERTHMNHKKLRRPYAEERLQVRRRGGRKHALGTRAPIALPQAANHRWSLDFASDALADGRRFPHPGRRRRLLTRVLVPGGRYPGGAWPANSIASSRTRPAAHLRLRQRHRADQHGDPAWSQEHR